MDTVRQGCLRFTLIQFSRLKINCLFKFFFILLLHPFALQAQQPESSSSDVEQQLEAIRRTMKPKMILLFSRCDSI